MIASLLVCRRETNGKLHGNTVPRSSRFRAAEHVLNAPDGASERDSNPQPHRSAVLHAKLILLRGRRANGRTLDAGCS